MTTYNPAWGWKRSIAQAAAKRCLLEYGDDENAIAALHEQTEAVWLWRDSETQHSIVTLPDCHVITHRGSDPRLADWWTNFQVRRTELSKGSGHRGFFKEADAVLPATMGRVSDGRPVVLLGHSKGAGIATALAYRMLERGGPAIAGLCTFGSPRVVDKRAADWIMAQIGPRAWRVVNGPDVVTRVPFSNPLRRHGGYKHVGQIAYIEHDLDVNLSPSRWQLFKDRLVGRFEALTGDEPTVLEVPGLVADQVERLEARALYRLRQVVGASIREITAAVGAGPAEAVLLWAASRAAGVALDNLDLAAAVFDGLHSHPQERYHSALVSRSDDGDGLGLPIPR